MPDGGVTTLTYHERFNSPLRFIEPNGAEWRWQYDAVGRTTARSNTFGHWSRFEYEEGLLSRASTPGGAMTELEHDDTGLVRRFAMMATGAERRLERDGLGRVVKIVDAPGGVERCGVGITGTGEIPTGVE